MTDGPVWLAEIPEPDEQVERRESRYSRAVFAAVDEALQSARSTGWRPGPQVGMVLATSRGDVELTRDLYLEETNRSQSQRYVSALPSTLLVELARRHSFSGIACTVGAGCAGGLTAVHLARQLLNTGSASDVVVIGVDVGTDPTTILSLAALGPLKLGMSPDRACRPFSDDTQGFTFGEGAAALVLSDGSAYGSINILATAAGNDHHHATSLNPDFSIMNAFVSSVLTSAAASRNDVSTFIAHGSGTTQCNSVDRHVASWLPNLQQTIALKPLIGHCRAAAPLLEFIAFARMPEQNRDPSAFHVIGPLASTTPVTLQLALGFGGNLAVAVYEGRHV